MKIGNETDNSGYGLQVGCWLYEVHLLPPSKRCAFANFHWHGHIIPTKLFVKFSVAYILWCPLALVSGEMRTENENTYNAMNKR